MLVFIIVSCSVDRLRISWHDLICFRLFILDRFRVKMVFFNVYLDINWLVFVLVLDFNFSFYHLFLSLINVFGKNFEFRLTIWLKINVFIFIAKLASFLPNWPLCKLWTLWLNSLLSFRVLGQRAFPSSSFCISFNLTLTDCTSPWLSLFNFYLLFSWHFWFRVLNRDFIQEFFMVNIVLHTVRSLWRI